MKLHSNDNIFIIPPISLCGTCFVVYNKDYCTTQDNVTHTDDRTAYIFRPQHEWGKLCVQTPYMFSVSQFLNKNFG